MRISKLFTLTLVIFGVVLFFGCEGPEGPAGPAGEAGAAGADAQVTCLDCHNDATLADNQFEMARSQHGLGSVGVGYAGGRGSCGPCHSHEQFVEFATTGDNAGNYLTPTPWKCSTCHGLHGTFDEEFSADTDYALRLTDPVTAMFDDLTSMDIDASSNLCIQCHQSRRGIDGYWNGTDAQAVITSSHTGPHHGPQANLLLGNNGSVAGTPFSFHVDAGCVGCHMKETTGEDELDVAGGHTFWPAVEACVTCHPSATDFDIGGVQEDIETKLHDLGLLLLGEGILAWEYDDSGDSSLHLHTGTYDAAVFQAFWNWVYVEEDRSFGVHNPTYAEDLLDAAIASVDGVPN